MLDHLSLRLQQEAMDAMIEEPEMEPLLRSTVLAPGVQTFEDAVASTIAYRLLQHPQQQPGASTMESFEAFLKSAMRNDELIEHGHTMKEAVRQDALAVLDRDPACETVLEVVLFYKGFAALVTHRAARQKWVSMQSSKTPASHQNNRLGRHFQQHQTSTKAASTRSMTSMFLQSQASVVFGVDIHPAATIGAGVMLDHGTGVVIGETAVVGDGCTLLHGVTLGGTGKDSGDRHPKLGSNVLIGAGASILGNIMIGNDAKIGAGSIVLKPVPAGATAVGSPAKIIGQKSTVVEKHQDPRKNDTLSVGEVTVDTTSTTTTSSSDPTMKDEWETSSSTISMAAPADISCCCDEEHKYEKCMFSENSRRVIGLRAC